MTTNPDELDEILDEAMLAVDYRNFDFKKANAKARLLAYIEKRERLARIDEVHQCTKHCFDLTTFAMLHERLKLLEQTEEK